MTASPTPKAATGSRASAEAAAALPSRVGLVLPAVFGPRPRPARPGVAPTTSFFEARRRSLADRVARGDLGADVTILEGLGGLLVLGAEAAYDDGRSDALDPRPRVSSAAPLPPHVGSGRRAPTWYLGADGLALPDISASPGAEPVVVGLIDSGVRAGEAELAHLVPGRLHVRGFDTLGRASAAVGASDGARGHGTTSAALVAGVTLGVEPGAVLAMAAVEQRASASGLGNLAAIWAAYDWLLKTEFVPGRRGADVICLGLATHSRDATARFLELPIAWARRAMNVLTIVPAGNCGLSDLAAYDDALVVGAHDWDGRVLPASGHGHSRAGATKPDLMAPGFQVAGFRDVGGRRVSGTSCAAAIAAGAAAWLMRRRPELRRAPDAAIAALRRHCVRRPGESEAERERSGWGRLTFGRPD